MLTAYATICHRNPIQQLNGNKKKRFGAFFYSHRAHCRAIGHALRMKFAAAWVAIAKQLQCGQWELLNHRATIQTTLTVKAAIYGSLYLLIGTIFFNIGYDSVGSRPVHEPPQPQ